MLNAFGYVNSLHQQPLRLRILVEGIDEFLSPRLMLHNGLHGVNHWIVITAARCEHARATDNQDAGQSIQRYFFFKVLLFYGEGEGS